MQHTLAQDITLNGIGLHKGEPVNVRIKPAPMDTGVVFVRTDLHGKPQLKAYWDLVQAVPLCTVLSDGVCEIATIEHLMAALVGYGVDNVIVEVDAAELPILDGSAKPYLDRIIKAGITQQAAPRHLIEVLRPVEVRDGDKFVRLEPSHQPYFHFSIDFESKAIGQQDREYVHLDVNRFAADIAPARSFAQKADVIAAQAAGYALGATIESGILVDDDHVVNEEGLRFSNEFVRHKLLDAMGDLFLAGGPVMGKFIAHKGGHALTNQVLRALFADQKNYQIREDYIGLHDRAAIPTMPGQVRTAKRASAGLSV